MHCAFESHSERIVTLECLAVQGRESFHKRRHIVNTHQLVLLQQDYFGCMPYVL